MGEVIVSIKDMVCRILLRWRLILVCMVLGAILLNGVGYVRNIKAIEEATKSESEQEREDESRLKSLKKKLTDYEATEVENANATYRCYQSQYDRIHDYIGNSIRMRINPNSVPTLTLQYLVDSHYETVYPQVTSKDMTANIVAAYMGAVHSEEIYGELAENWKEKVDPSYLEELVTVSSGMTVSSGTTTSSGTAANISIVSNSDLLTITIIAETREDCEKIAEAVEQKLNAETPGLQSVYGEFDFICVQDSYGEDANVALITEQQTQLNNLNTLTTAMKNLSSNMTNDQKEYYSALLNVKETEEERTEDQVEAAEKESGAIVKIIHIKYIILGLFLGAFLACCYVCLRYLLTNKLRLSEDMEACFGVPVLGLMEGEKTRKKILKGVDQWILKLMKKNVGQAPESGLKMCCSRVQLMMKQNDMDKICLAGSCNDAETDRIKQEIEKQLEQNFKVICCSDSLLNNADALKKTVETGNVVLVERVGKSLYSDLQREMELCSLHQVKILGSVVLD